MQTAVRVAWLGWLLSCSPVNHETGGLGGLGDACDASRPCGPNLSCAEGTCIADTGADASCTTGDACSLLTQTGCDNGLRCSWIHPDNGSPAIGHIGCTVPGSVPTGGACHYTPAATAACDFGQTGNGADDCVAGDVCAPNQAGVDVCTKICDDQGGDPKCAATETCTTQANLFSNGGTPPAGVCEANCDPLADNDFAGSDVGSKTGTTCGSDRAIGCYGFRASNSTHFSCALPAGGYTGSGATGNLVEGAAVPPADQFFNSCAPGYSLGIFSNLQGSTQSVCLAFCAPASSYGPLGGANVGTTAAGPNGGKSADGVSHQCNTTDARGAFGVAAKPDGTNGEHCVYSWAYEVDPVLGSVPSPTGDTVGICLDHTKFRYDSNNDGSITAADAEWPACATLPLAQANGSQDPLYAGSFGCVDHTHGGPDGSPVGAHPGFATVLVQRPTLVTRPRSIR